MCIRDSSITVNLAGTSQVGSINNTKGGTIVLKSGFTGSAEIVPTSTAIDTVVATVEEGAQTSDITVEGLDTNTYELVVNENDQLVIAEKSGETKMTRVTFGGNPDQGEISEDGEKFTVGDTVATAWKGTIEKSTKGETLSITATQDTKSVTNEYDVPGGEAGSVEAESVFYVLVDAVVDAMTFIIK